MTKLQQIKELCSIKGMLERIDGYSFDDEVYCKDIIQRLETIIYQLEIELVKQWNQAIINKEGINNDTNL